MQPFGSLQQASWEREAQPNFPAIGEGMILERLLLLVSLRYLLVAQSVCHARAGHLVIGELIIFLSKDSCLGPRRRPWFAGTLAMSMTGPSIGLYLK